MTSVPLSQVCVIALGALGIVWYFICIFVIGLKRLADNPPLRDFMSVSITTISISLATFVGMLLGLRGVGEQLTAGVNQVAPNTGSGSAERAMGARTLTRLAQSTEGTTLQWSSAILYLASLVLAIYFWYRGGPQTDPAITKLAQSLLGLIGGSLSVLLNLPGNP